jgi:hypothetical protein
VRLDLPAGYRPVPLDADPLVRLARTERMVRMMFPAADDAQLAAATAHFSAVADLQGGNGVAAAALRYSRAGDEFTAAYVSCALTPLDYESVEVAAMGIFDSFTTPDLPAADLAAEPPPDGLPRADGLPPLAGGVAGDDGPGVFRDGRYVVGVALPCGPAVALTELRTVRVEAAESPSGEAAGVDVGVLQVHVPVKEFQCLFVLTLTTPVLAEFGPRCLDGAAMAMSLRFSSPDGGGEIGWRPHGLIGAAALGHDRR